jgi:hypothetical protein
VKKVAILQSNYVPWKGYFDLIKAVDEFIIYDDMQFTKRDWRNRNQIKTPNGLQWLTIPVLVKGNYHQKIRDVSIQGTEWASRHWKTLLQNYRSAAYFHEIANWLEPLYLNNSNTNLSKLNRQFMEQICSYLNIETKLSNSWDYSLVEGRTERLTDLCIKAGATEYISGPSAKNYIDEKVFLESGIKLSWFDYDGYSEYPQLWGSFCHQVTILDVLFNCGRDSHKHMR